MRMEPHGVAHGVERTVVTLSFVYTPLLLISVVLAATASADSAFDRAHGRCEIEFFATSTARNVQGTANARPFLLTRHTDESGETEWWSASVELSVTDLITGWDERDNDMHWMLDANHYPSIFAEFPHIESEAYASEHLDEAAPLEFRLTIRDVTRPMTAKVVHWDRDGDRASFDAEFDVSTSEFEIKTPTLLGLLRVGDIVSVHAHVEIGRSPHIEYETNDAS